MRKPLRDSGKIDWLQIEARVREALRAYVRGEIMATHACRLIDGAFAVGTLRGNDIAEAPLDWEARRDVEDANSTISEWWDQRERNKSK